MWNIKIYLLVVLGLMLLAAPVATMAETDSEHAREYQIKAAFLYNFTKFVDWPKEEIADCNKPVVLGIVCDDPLAEAFDLLKEKSIKGRKIQIKYFRRIELPSTPQEDDEDKYRQTIQSLRDCHVLFVCGPAGRRHRNILRVIKGAPVLTIGEAAQFVKNGGVINFVKRSQKIRFEINLTAAREANLKIRSGLLKLAVRVLDEGSEKEKRRH